jgi:sugar lactone lactonase YvrE
MRYALPVCLAAMLIANTACVRIFEKTGLGNFDSGGKSDSTANSDATAKRDISSTDAKLDQILCTSGTVITLAGNGTSGFADGPVASAMFSEPHGVVVDGGGRVYVADTSNHRIRMIYHDQVTTLAGSGTFGFADGPASDAMFFGPSGVAVDSSENVFVADQGNQRIRKITAGQVSTLAGSGAVGFADGPAAVAMFNEPSGVAVDSTGKVYVADNFNHRIRLISNGVVSTFAGNGTLGFADGPLSSAMFSVPTGIALDTTGKMYVADDTNDRIRLIVGEQVSTFAGSGTEGFHDGAASLAQFNWPTSVAVNSAVQVVVADLYNHRIRKIANGQVTTLARKWDLRLCRWTYSLGYVQ